MRGGVKLLLELIGALIVLGIAGSAYAVWRLAESPWAMPFAKTILERAMSDPASGRAVTVGMPLLIWNRVDRAIEIEFHDVSVRGIPVINAIDVAVMRARLDTGSLLRGVLAPAEITLLHPRLRVTGAADRGFSVAVGEPDRPSDADAPLDATRIDQIRAAFATDPRAAHLVRARVVDGDLTVHDTASGKSFHAPGVSLSLTREVAGVRLEADLVLSVPEAAPFGPDPGGAPTPAAPATETRLFGVVHFARRMSDHPATVTGKIDLRGASVSRVASALTTLAPPSWTSAIAAGTRVDMVLNAGLTFAAPLAVALDPSALARADGAAGVEASLQADWGAGRIADPLIPGGGLSFQGGGLAARYDGKADVARVEDFHVTLPFGAATAVIEARAPFGALAINATLGFDQLSVVDLRQLWPESVAPNPRRWIVKNLQRGTIKDLKARVAAARAGPDQPLAPGKIEAGFDFSGARVVYLDGMPPLDKLSGSARMTPDRMDLDIKGGELRALKLVKGEVALTDFQAKDQHILIKGDLEGELPEALDLLDGPRLGYIKRFGVSGKSAAGAMSTHLEFRFPAIDALSIDDVKISATASVRGGALPKAVAGQDLAAADLALTLDGQGMEVTGAARLGPVPLTVRWIENFKAKAPFQRRIEAMGTVDDAARSALGVAMEGRVKGPVGARIAYTDYAGRDSELEASLDLKSTDAAIEELGWSKPAGREGTARLLLAIAEGRIKAIRNIDLDAADLSARGSMSFDKSGRFEQVTVTRLKTGGTDAGGSLARRKDGGFDVRVAGAGFDARPLLAPPKDPAEPETGFDDLKLPPLSIEATLGRVLLEDGGVMTGLDASATHDGARWRSARVTARLGPAPVSLTLTPGQAHRDFSFVTDDAGGLLDTLGVTADVKHGHLEIKGTLDNARQLLTAHMTGRDFQLIRAPFLAKLLAVASVTGIPELLGGQGIGFTVLEADFTRTATLNTLKRARMSGLTLGLTVEGTISRPAMILDLTGTIVPVYSLNGVLNSVPLLGDLLTGGPGGGIFAWTYSAKGDFAKPDIGVNPLSAITPSIVRNLFDWIGDQADKPAAPK